MTDPLDNDEERMRIAKLLGEKYRIKPDDTAHLVFAHIHSIPRVYDQSVGRAHRMVAMDFETLCPMHHLESKSFTAMHIMKDGNLKFMRMLTGAGKTFLMERMQFHLFTVDVMDALKNRRGGHNAKTLYRIPSKRRHKLKRRILQQYRTGNRKPPLTIRASSDSHWSMYAETDTAKMERRMLKSYHLSSYDEPHLDAADDTDFSLDC